MLGWLGEFELGFGNCAAKFMMIHILICVSPYVLFDWRDNDANGEGIIHK